MNKKSISQVLLSIGLFCCFISNFIQWLGVGGYTWGFSRFGYTSIFYIDFYGYEDFGTTLIAISMTITLILVIITVIIGSIAHYSISNDMKPYNIKITLFAAIISLATIIFVTVATIIGTSMMKPLVIGGLVSTWDFNYGFYLMIISTIIFFVTYVIQRTTTILSSKTSGKLCQECGAKLKRNEKFCHECGKKL